MTTTIRMFPPTGAPNTSQSAFSNGNLYTCSVGSTIDVLTADAPGLVSQRWASLAPSGPTSARTIASSMTCPPYPAGLGMMFFDTTLSKMIGFDGGVWRDPATGLPV